MIVRNHDNENYVAVTERLKAMTRTLAAYFGQDKVEVSLVSRGGRNEMHVPSFSGYYHKKTDTFELDWDWLTNFMQYIAVSKKQSSVYN